jgi:hypothetical protein
MDSARAKRIRILEIQVDAATKARRSLRKAERAEADAQVTKMCDELGALYVAERAARK